MFLLLAAVFFGVFATNVAIGSARGVVFLNDVGEMLMLFAAVASFVVAVLRSEAARNRKRHAQDIQGRNDNE